VCGHAVAGMSEQIQQRQADDGGDEYSDEHERGPAGGTGPADPGNPGDPG
jgi:hypothetical protein